MAQMVNIHPIDVHERLQQGEELQVIDVRERAEVATGKIPGAKHIPLGQLSTRLQEIDPQKDAVIVCHSGSRSAMACDFLLSSGYAKVTNMLGGMSAWSWRVE